MAFVLVVAGNVFAPAFAVLRSRGYHVEARAEAGGDQWLARRGDEELVADDPLQLLGLACMLEKRGRGWSATDDEVNAYLAQLRRCR